MVVSGFVDDSRILASRRLEGVFQVAKQDPRVMIGVFAVGALLCAPSEPLFCSSSFDCFIIVYDVNHYLWSIDADYFGVLVGARRDKAYVIFCCVVFCYYVLVV